MEHNTVLFICTHGDFAKAIIQSAEMIIGPMETAIPICLQPGMSGDDYLELVEQKAEAYQDHDILVLADLFGGTPCNTTARLVRTYPIQIVTGLNLGMLLEVFSNLQTASMEELVSIALEAASMGCVDVNERLGCSSKKASDS